MKIPINFHHKCLSCEKDDHFLDECNFTHYIPDKIILFQKLFYSEYQERNICFRSTTKRRKIKASSKIDFVKVFNFNLTLF